MQQNQFNPKSMIQLLDDMQREISTQATRIDKHITRDNLTKLGDDISGRSMLGQEAPAAPAPAPASSYDADKEARYQKWKKENGYD
jgi:hypothetical protein